MASNVVTANIEDGELVDELYILLLILKERRRQIRAERWTTAHDDGHVDGELADAAACYCIHRDFGHAARDEAHGCLWPWDATWFKPTPADRERELIKAGALIVAEIERLWRMKAKEATNDRT